MIIADIIKLSQDYNELVCKIIKGEIWFQQKEVSDSDKKAQEPRYNELINQLCKSADELEQLNITFNELNINGLSIIELPEQFKRPKIEVWLNEFSKHIKNKRSV
jgi:hypothetical protein